MCHASWKFLGLAKIRENIYQPIEQSSLLDLFRVRIYAVEMTKPSEHFSVPPALSLCLWHRVSRRIPCIFLR